MARQKVFDFMAIAAGLQPNTMLLAGQVDMRENGAIVVDDTMKSSNPDIYAIGDSAVVDGKYWSILPVDVRCVEDGPRGRLCGGRFGC